MIYPYPYMWIRAPQPANQTRKPRQAPPRFPAPATTDAKATERRRGGTIEMGT
jgi:hypothetical protein